MGGENDLTETHQETVKLDWQRLLSEPLIQLTKFCQAKASGIYQTTGSGWRAIATAGDPLTSLPSVELKSGQAITIPSVNQLNITYLVIGIPQKATNPEYLLAVGILSHTALKEIEGYMILAADLFYQFIQTIKEAMGFGELLDGVSDPILVTDEKGNISFANTVAQQYFDFTVHVGKPIWGLVASETDSADLKLLFHQRSREMKRHCRFVNKRGDISLMEVAVTELYKGKRVWHLRDLSEEMRSADHIARSFRVATLGELAAGIAHEINNPLQVIMGNTELAMDSKNIDESVKEKLSDILTAAGRIKEITRSVTRFADARRSQEQELLEFNSIVADAAQLASYTLIREEVPVKTELAMQIPPVLGRRGDLEEVIVQLIRNSGEAITESGKGSIIIVRSYGQSGKVRLEVEDDGPGIPTELRERIFDPFVTTKAIRGRTGLGLALVQNIVAAHGGRIWVEDVVPHGAKFIIELPAWQSEE